jgi:mRNA interferase RelE/StbE
MAPYRIEWKHSAMRELRRLPPEMVLRIMEAVTQLSNEPFPPGTRKLVGSDQTFRLRIGDYRVIYTVSVVELVVEIVRVRHRKEVYR